MNEISDKHKKPFVIAGIIAVVILLIIYLRAVFLTGLWYGDTFLYKQSDGSFSGSDIYADYKMYIEQTDNGTDITFSVNNTTRNYSIIYDLADRERNVKILENDTLIFQGKAHGSGQSYLLLDDDYGMADPIEIRVNNEIPAEEELFPGNTSLYEWSVNKGHDIRGNPVMLILILIAAVILFLDIKCPDLFWLLEHGLDVDGGEPSYWYRSCQKFGRIIDVAAIIIFVILTFTMR